MGDAGYDIYNFVKVEIFTQKAVALIKLNRHDKMNALSSELVSDLVSALNKLDKDDSVRAIIITGTDRFFVAGADISQMNSSNNSTFVQEEMFKPFDEIENISKPIIAAVNGYALGGGCELAMMCDIIIAGDKAKFGQPEISLAIIPGIGGTQRLVKAIGKSKAMEFILTGKMFTAEEAYQMGLVSKVFPAETLETEAVNMAEKIASFSAPAVAAAKASVNFAFQSNLKEGLSYETKTFHKIFQTEDREAGMTAFVKKQKPEWKHK